MFSARRTSAGGVLTAAVHAQPPHEALRDDADERRRDDVGLGADVHQARDDRRRVVGVQRRQHEVAGLRRLHRDLRGLGVADLAEQDDVGILPQDRAQRARERQLDLLVDLRLVDARDLSTRPDPRS